MLAIGHGPNRIVSRYNKFLHNVTASLDSKSSAKVARGSQTKNGVSSERSGAVALDPDAGFHLATLWSLQRQAELQNRRSALAFMAVELSGAFANTSCVILQTKSGSLAELFLPVLTLVG